MGLSSENLYLGVSGITKIKTFNAVMFILTIVPPPGLRKGRSKQAITNISNSWFDVTFAVQLCIDRTYHKTSAFGPDS